MNPTDFADLSHNPLLHMGRIACDIKASIALPDPDMLDGRDQLLNLMQESALKIRPVQAFKMNFCITNQEYLFQCYLLLNRARRVTCVRMISMAVSISS